MATVQPVQFFQPPAKVEPKSRCLEITLYVISTLLLVAGILVLAKVGVFSRIERYWGGALLGGMVLFYLLGKREENRESNALAKKMALERATEEASYYPMQTEKETKQPFPTYDQLVKTYSDLKTKFEGKNFSYKFSIRDGISAEASAQKHNLRQLIEVIQENVERVGSSTHKVELYLNNGDGSKIKFTWEW